MLERCVDDVENELRIVCSEWISSINFSLSWMDTFGMKTGDTFPGVDDLIGVGLANRSDEAE